MQEQRSSVVSKKRIKLSKWEQPPAAIIYQSIGDTEKVDCAVEACCGGKKSQPGVQPICQIHSRYFDHPRGWAFVFKQEVDIINIGREYGLANKILELARDLKLKIETEIMDSGMGNVVIDKDKEYEDYKSDGGASSTVMMEDYEESGDEF